MACWPMRNETAACPLVPGSSSLTALNSRFPAVSMSSPVIIPRYRTPTPASSPGPCSLPSSSRRASWLGWPSRSWPSTGPRWKGEKMDHLARQILKDVALEEIAPKAAQNGPRNPMDHWSPAILLERAAYLKKMARYGDGTASETLREYPQHRAMLSF